MTMRQNGEQKWEDMTLKSLEAELRRLGEVEVPETLEAKLLAAIPDGKAKVAQEHRVKRHRGAWDFGVTAAAAVLIFGLLFMVSYGLSVPSQALLTEFDDTSLCCARWEQGNFLNGQSNTLIEDTNYANCNGR